MQESLPQSARLTIFGFIVLSFLLSFATRRSPLPQLAVFNRWTRWIAISVGLGYLLYESGWLNRPFWVISAMVFVGWMLLETVYTWLAIGALSQSGLSLFPRFSENQSGEEWPVNRKLIELKDWLRSHGYSRKQAVVAEIGSGISVRSSIFQNEEQTIRFQILFVPQSNGDVGFCVSFSSETEAGQRILTDNLYMPYGGFYPESWNVVRKPWTRSVPRLHRMHKRRVEGQRLSPFESEPVADLNEQQRALEKTNIDEGFLVPPHLQEEYGRITWEGRYRVWKEVWLLNYFGVSSN